ncbi:CHAT domain-containing tetratricopeptide repeat protein [Nocardia sp. NPDC019255]|uniref:CHAT domain-containing protein n=1 Tax=Nocardia sp. NPDC019255 TaxID=3154591 RepID=UPI0033C95062
METSSDPTGGLFADRRIALQSAIAARIRRMELTDDPAAVLAPEADRQARELVALVNGGDLESALLAGWFYWYRYEARPQQAEHRDLSTAVEMFTACFVTGVDLAQLPQQLLPLLAEEAALVAVALLDQTQESDDVEFVTAVLRLWWRILAATPSDSSARGGILCNLGIVLLARFRLTRDAENLRGAIEVGRLALTGIPADRADRGTALAQLSAALRARFHEAGAGIDLDEAITLGRHAIDATPEHHPYRPGIIANLATALWQRFEFTGGPADLDEAIRLRRLAVETAPSDYDDLPNMLSGLAMTLHTRFEHTGNPQDLDEAIELGRRAIADPAGRSHPLSNLSSALHARFEIAGARADLDEAIALGRRALAALPAGSPDLGLMLSNLGNALHTRYKATRQVASLDEAMELGRRAVDATPTGHPDRSGFQANLANTLRTRYSHTGALADLDEAIDVGRQAAAATPVGHPDLARMLANLGAFLHIRFERTQFPQDLAEAVDLHTEAVAATPDEHPARGPRLAGLGAALWSRYQQTAVPEDLEEAIDLLEQAEPLISATHPDRPMVLHSLADTMRARFERTRKPVHLDTAIAYGEQAVAACDPGLPGREPIVAALEMALHARFDRSGALEDLRRVVGLRGELVATAAADDPAYLSMLYAHAQGLRTLYEHTGTPALLDEAIEVGAQALARTPADHPDRAMVAGDHGYSVMLRFERTAATTDLDEAIDLHTEALAATPADDPKRHARLTGLGSCLLTRYERFGALPDLENAVAFTRRALAEAPADHADRAGILTALGAALWARFKRIGALPDIDEAIEHLRDALRTVSDDLRLENRIRSNLGLALRTRFERTAGAADLDEAIATARQAVAATPADHSDRAQTLHTFENTLMFRFRENAAAADLADIDEAIDIGRQAIAAATPESPGLGGMLLSLGGALYARFERTASAADRDEAVGVFRRAIDTKTATPSIRVRAAHGAALSAAGSDPALAARMLEGAVRTLPELVPPLLDRIDQQHALGNGFGIAADAAALALNDPSTAASARPELALRLLEAGRAILLGRTLNIRGDLTELAVRHPDLAQRFTRLRARLDHETKAATTLDIPLDPAAVISENGRHVRDRRQLVAEFDRLLAEIRAQDGFRTFALPPSIGELLAQSEQGAIVTFNISRYRCDALVLAEGAVTGLALPGLTMDDVVGRAVNFQRALDVTRYSPIAAERRAAERQLLDSLEWLWDTAASPVLEALGHNRIPPAGSDWPRVWWAPGGILGLLPVHAAGYHSSGPTSGGRSVLDRVVSSYTPTIAALRYARERRARQHSAGATRAAIVAMPTTPGVDGRLHHVLDEARIVERLLPDSVVLTEPDPAPEADSDPARTLPTKANVLASLSSCSIAHFICHGTSDPSDPSLSRLLLHDHATDPLTVSALAPVQLDHARLAYLSACETARIVHAELLDEATHLASAFQLAGYPHVIGTLWTIDDETAVEVAEAFYTALTSARDVDDLAIDKAPVALHEAIRSIRGTLPRTPSLWAAYLHSGA